jgi:hypothetical protein
MSARSAERVEVARRAVALSVVVSCRLLRVPEDLNAAPTIEIAVLSRTSPAPVASPPRERPDAIDTRLTRCANALPLVSGRTHRVPSRRSATVKRNESTTLRGPPRASVAKIAGTPECARRRSVASRLPLTRTLKAPRPGGRQVLVVSGRPSEEPEGSYEPKSRAVAIWPVEDAKRRMDSRRAFRAAGLCIWIDTLDAQMKPRIVRAASGGGRTRFEARPIVSSGLSRHGLR